MTTIALVNDNRFHLINLRMILEAEGYEIQSYPDPVWGHECILRDSPDLAIIGNKMRRMDGMELLRRLKQKTDIPVIYYSLVYETNPDPDNPHSAEEYVLSTCSPEYLIECVREVLNASRRFKNYDFRGEETHVFLRGKLSLDVSQDICLYGELGVSLTRVETILLHEVIRRTGVARSHENLIAAASAEGFDLDKTSANAAMNSLMTKFSSVDNEFDELEFLYDIAFRWKERRGDRNEEIRHEDVRQMKLHGCQGRDYAMRYGKTRNAGINMGFKSDLPRKLWGICCKEVLVTSLSNEPDDDGFYRGTAEAEGEEYHLMVFPKKVANPYMFGVEDFDEKKQEFFIYLDEEEIDRIYEMPVEGKLLFTPRPRWRYDEHKREMIKR